MRENGKMGVMEGDVWRREGGGEGVVGETGMGPGGASTYIYIYIYMCVCVFMCLCSSDDEYRN